MKFNRGKMTVTGYLNGHQMVIEQTAGGFQWRTRGQKGSAPDLESAQRAAIDAAQ